MSRACLGEMFVFRYNGSKRRFLAGKWPCDPLGPQNGADFWYCEDGPGWKPPAELRERARKDDEDANTACVAVEIADASETTAKALALRPADDLELTKYNGTRSSRARTVINVVFVAIPTTVVRIARAAFLMLVGVMARRREPRDVRPVPSSSDRQ